MARGMVVNEAITSQAATEEFRSGYDRTFGADRKPQRGSYVYDARLGKCVPRDEYVAPEDARNAPIISGRIHEGQRAPDGTDISTPAKRRAYMKATGNADYDDFKGAREARARAVEEKRRIVETGKVEKHDPRLRDFIGRELYKRKVII